MDLLMFSRIRRTPIQSLMMKICTKHNAIFHAVRYSFTCHSKSKIYIGDWHDLYKLVHNKYLNSRPRGAVAWCATKGPWVRARPCFPK